MQLLSGISVVCFAASYGVALALEILRTGFRRSLPQWILLGVAGAGMLAHTLFLVHRAVTADDIPLSSPFDWDLLGTWLLVATYIYFLWYHPRMPIGLFLLPLALGLIGVAHWADRKPFAQSQAGQVWGLIHGLFHLLGLAAVTIGFVAGLMYLIQSWRLKKKLPQAQQLRLPSLEWLERVNGRALLISLIFIGLGFASGVVLNMVLRRQKIDNFPWTDPVVWRSAAMVLWLLAAVLFSALYRPARSGRKVAYLTVASFLFLASSLAIRLFVPSEHGKAQSGSRKGETVAARQFMPNAQIPRHPHTVRSTRVISSFPLPPSALSLEVLL